MHTSHGPREDPLGEMGYEVRDINVKGLKTAAIGFFVFATFSFGVGWLIYRYWMNAPRMDGPQPGPYARVIPAAPNPLLQTNLSSKTDIETLRKNEDVYLKGQADWVDPQKTHLHIPIDQAMQIIATRGLPKTNGEVTAPPAPKTSPAPGGLR